MMSPVFIAKNGIECIRALAVELQERYPAASFAELTDAQLAEFGVASGLRDYCDDAMPDLTPVRNCIMMPANLSELVAWRGANYPGIPVLGGGILS